MIEGKKVKLDMDKVKNGNTEEIIQAAVNLICGADMIEGGPELRVQAVAYFAYVAGRTTIGAEELYRLGENIYREQARCEAAKQAGAIESYVKEELL